MKLIFLFTGATAVASLSLPRSALAQIPLVLPQLQLGFNQPGSTGEVATGLQILALLTVLTMAPSILVMMTSFSRIVIVLAFMRQALGTQQSPPNQVLIGLAMFLTMFSMAPVGTRINNDALQPYFAERIDFNTAAQRAATPVRNFMLKQTREKDLALFLTLSGGGAALHGERCLTRYADSGFFDQRVENSFSDWIHAFYPVLDHRYGCSVSSLVFGNDDASACPDFSTV